MVTMTRWTWSVLWCSLALGLAAFACAEEEKQRFDGPVRPQLDQIVLGGELGLDKAFDKIIRPGRIPRREVRGPLVGLNEVLKGSDFFRERTRTLVPLRSGFSSRPCANREAPCPGRADLAEALNQSGIDAVSLAGSSVVDAGAAALDETRRVLAERRICGTGGPGGEEACLFRIGDTRVAFLGMSAVTGEERGAAATTATRLVGAARKNADVVVLAVALDRHSSSAERRALANDISDKAGPEVLLGHFDGPFDAPEIRKGRLVLHNPGRMLMPDEPPGEAATAFLYRIHFTPKGVSWLEGIPIRLFAGRTRQAYAGEANRAVEKLLRLAKNTAPGLLAEHGRALADIQQAP